MAKHRLHPYLTPDEVHSMVQHLHDGLPYLVHPQQVLHEARLRRSTIGRFNGWLADHIVGLAGTMAFFYFLAALMGAWAIWQVTIQHDKGFDPYPFSFLFFILGGIMQSLFVPTMLTAQNRSAMRDRIKDEVDHRAWSHLYECNDEQLVILRRLDAWLDEQGASKVQMPSPPAS